VAKDTFAVYEHAPLKGNKLETLKYPLI